jgi:GAF domain-containing protein
VQSLLEERATTSDILTYLTTVSEAISGGEAVSSILLLDDKGLLTNGASPKLPTDYLQAIDKLKPDENVGTCAAAAATGSIVVTPDFLADDKWAELKHLPMELGFQAAWSSPIMSKTGSVLGTFGTYYRERRSPTPSEIRDIGILASMAANVIESS